MGNTISRPRRTFSLGISTNPRKVTPMRIRVEKLVALQKEMQNSSNEHSRNATPIKGRNSHDDAKRSLSARRKSNVADLGSPQEKPRSMFSHIPSNGKNCFYFYNLLANITRISSDIHTEKKIVIRRAQVSQSPVPKTTISLINTHNINHLTVQKSARASSIEKSASPLRNNANSNPNTYRPSS